MPITKIQSESLNLADTYAFTGTVTGTPSNTPAFSVTNGSAQSLSDSTLAKVEFDTENYDTDSAFDTSTYRFTVPSGKAGKYHFDAIVAISANSTYTGSTNQFQVRLTHKNSSDVEQKKIAARRNFNYCNIPNATVAGDFDMAVGDYVECSVYVTASGLSTDAGNATTHFSGHKLT